MVGDLGEWTLLRSSSFLLRRGLPASGGAKGDQGFEGHIEGQEAEG